VIPKPSVTLIEKIIDNQQSLIFERKEHFSMYRVDHKFGNARFLLIMCQLVEVERVSLTK